MLYDVIVHPSFQVGLSRRGADILFRHLRNKRVDVVKNQAIWDFRDGLSRPPTRTYAQLIPATLRGKYGNPRYVEPRELLLALFRNKAFARTMDLSIGKGENSFKQLLVVFSIDGAELHSTASGVFGFIRVLNQVNFVNR